MQTLLVVLSEPCYWHLVSRGQGCCILQCSEQPLPHTSKNDLTQKAKSAKLERPCTLQATFTSRHTFFVFIF